jgi:hypothetical protein
VGIGADGEFTYGTEQAPLVMVPAAAESEVVPV